MFSFGGVRGADEEADLTRQYRERCAMRPWGKKEIQDRKREIMAEVESLRPLITDIAEALHDNPELGLQEVFAAKKLTGILEEHGFGVQRGVARLPTAFRATLGSASPNIAFMAEYDALPGIGHGCGHNLIAAVAVSAGIAMSKVCPPEEGVASWTVLGTPAEETVGGKAIMVQEGAFQGIDAALIAHPGQRSGVGGGTSWASHPLEITFHGKTAHAGSNPEGGVNALDACVLAYMSVRNLRNRLRDPVRLAGIITKGGDAPNVIPDLAQMRFTLRSTDWRYLEHVVIPKVRECAQGAASALGAEVQFRHHEELFRETLHYPALQRACLDNLQLVGEEVPGQDGGGGGVTDVGNVTWVIPAIQISFNSTSAPGHTKEMAESTVTKRGIDAAVRAAQVLSSSALDLAVCHEILEEARNYLEARLSASGAGED